MTNTYPSSLFHCYQDPFTFEVSHAGDKFFGFCLGGGNVLGLRLTGLNGFA